MMALVERTLIYQDGSILVFEPETVVAIGADGRIHVFEDSVAIGC